MAIRQRKQPIHEIFYLCSSYTPDEAWKEFLKDCSFGKFPYGIRFQNGIIKCTRKGKAFEQPLPLEAEKALSVIMTVFRDKLGMANIKEKKSASAKFDKLREEKRIRSWKEATTMAAKQSLIRTYASKFATYYSLSHQEHSDLIMALSLAISSKVLSGDRIHVQEGGIRSIDGVHFDPVTRKVLIDGHIPQSMFELVSVPVDFKPVPQICNVTLQLGILEHHVKKQETVNSLSEKLEKSLQPKSVTSN
jgi:hypothetical protein